MSHFTVAVRVSANVSLENIPSEIEFMLRPYFEHGDPDFMEFQDCTDEAKADWEANKYDEQSDHKTFEDYLESRYKSHKVDDETRWGYWSNPHAKWDWYQIGGRWAGHWPAKAGSEAGKGERSWANEGEDIPSNQVDIIRIKDIDFANADAETDKRVQKFLEDYDKFFKTGETPEGDNLFYGVRHTALSLDLVQCLNDDEITEERRATCKLDPWPQDRWFKNDAGEVVPRYDVIAPLPSDAKFTEFVRNHFNKLRTYAYLDEDGWVEPGEMGWIVISNGIQTAVSGASSSNASAGTNASGREEGGARFCNYHWWRRRAGQRAGLSEAAGRARRCKKLTSGM
jgi:hypothetical protein